MMLQSHSSAVTDDEGKESSSIKHGAERIIRTVYAQNKVCGILCLSLAYLYIRDHSLFEKPMPLKRADLSGYCF